MSPAIRQRILFGVHGSSDCEKRRSQQSLRGTLFQVPTALYDISGCTYSFALIEQALLGFEFPSSGGMQGAKDYCHVASQL